LTWFIKHKRLLAVGLFLGLVTIFFQATGLKDNFSMEFVRQIFHENELTGLLVFIALFSLGNLIQIPGWLFLVAAVMTLGRTEGGLATYIAAIVSCTITFASLRFIGGNALRQIDNRFAQSLLNRLDAHPTLSIFLLRTLFQTAPALNYALAVSGVDYRSYMIGTLLGLPFPIAVYCYFFDSLNQIFK
jgi:uncharacterized membrane protein YdjX (TVP38/TMEM64 family)